MICIIMLRKKVYHSTQLRRFRIHFFGFFQASALRLACASWRKRSIGLQQLDHRLAAGDRQILVFWHGKYVTFLPLLRNRNACVFTSMSSRGDAIAEILRRFGFSGCQLPDHGRDASLAVMRSALMQSMSGAIAVDGPLGPQHVVHRGAVQLASELGYSLVPASVAISHKRTLTARWDNLELPRLFSRVQLVIGKPLSVPANLQNDELNTWIATVHDALEAVNRDAEERLIAWSSGQEAGYWY